MAGVEHEKYIGYKTSVLTLFVGILIGVLTNYIAVFFQASYEGLALSVLGILVVSFFYLSRFRSPSFMVIQRFPKELIKDKTPMFITNAEPHFILFHRFLYLANLEVSSPSFDTLFEIRKSDFDTAFRHYDVSVRARAFLPLSEERYIEDIARISDSLHVTDEEKKALKDAVRNKYEGIGVGLSGGHTFDYRSVLNRLLRGKGVFFLNRFGEPAIGCVIIPALSCIASRHYEEYHIFLQNKLKTILEELINDPAFCKAFVSLFE